MQIITLARYGLSKYLNYNFEDVYRAPISFKTVQGLTKKLVAWQPHPHENVQAACP